jgi:hypothetical protein
VSTRQETLSEDLHAVRALLARRDPELLDAVAEVDRSLIQAWLLRDPWERARCSFEMAAGIAELKTWRRTG